jgi:hypothetical protein
MDQCVLIHPTVASLDWYGTLVYRGSLDLVDTLCTPGSLAM